MDTCATGGLVCVVGTDRRTRSLDLVTAAKITKFQQFRHDTINSLLEQ